MTEVDLIKKPWERLMELVEAGDSVQLLDFLNSINPMDTALAISRLRPDQQGKLLTMLTPEDAAEVIEDLPEVQAAELIEDLSPGQAAAILEELGDVLFQVLFVAYLYEQEHQFTLQQVLERIIGKMVHRHPHVFGGPASFVILAKAGIQLNFVFFRGFRG